MKGWGGVNRGVKCNKYLHRMLSVKYIENYLVVRRNHLKMGAGYDKNKTSFQNSPIT